MTFFQAYFLFAVWKWVGGWTGIGLALMAIMSLFNAVALEWKGKKEQGDFDAK